MANYNKVTLIGTLTRDPEIKYTPKGTAIADIGLAINRTWKNDSGEKMEDVVRSIRNVVDEHYWLPLFGMSGASAASGGASTRPRVPAAPVSATTRATTRRAR